MAPKNAGTKMLYIVIVVEKVMFTAAWYTIFITWCMLCHDTRGR